MHQYLYSVAFDMFTKILGFIVLFSVCNGSRNIEQILVMTGDEDGAGTDAYIDLTICSSQNLCCTITTMDCYGNIDN